MKPDTPILPAASTRIHFPDDEARQPWLALLLDVQQITDQAVSEGIQRETRKGKTLACARGCASCCRTHTDIPVYPLELMGIAWYATEKLAAPLRAQVQTQLQKHATRDACPFLVDEACAIHPLRPMACRHFNVFGRQCAPGEDAFHTRREAVLTPIKALKDKSLRVMLRHHQDIKSETERRRQVESGEVHRLAQSLRDLRWETLAARMAVFDKTIDA